MANKFVTSRFINTSEDVCDRTGLATFYINGQTLHLEITSDAFSELSDFMDKLALKVAHNTLEVIRDDLIRRVNSSVLNY